MEAIKIMTRGEFEKEDLECSTSERLGFDLIFCLGVGIRATLSVFVL